VKFSEVLQCCDVLLVLSFLSLSIWLYILYTFVISCKLCILIVMFLCSYSYVCSVMYILFSSCQLALFGYPDCGFSVLFPQLWGKYQGVTPKDGARSALVLISELCCSVYCLFVNVFCTTATGCLPHCSYVYHISYHIISYHNNPVNSVTPHIPSSQAHIRFPLILTYQKISPIPGLCEMIPKRTEL
jgi:hypothetical protein